MRPGAQHCKASFDPADCAVGESTLGYSRHIEIQCTLTLKCGRSHSPLQVDHGTIM